MVFHNKCCIVQCIYNSKIKHTFPNPDKDIIRFRKWLSVIKNPELDKMNPSTVFKIKRICHSHFEDTCFSSWSTRLYATAIPTLHLHNDSSSNVHPRSISTLCAKANVTDNETVEDHEVEKNLSLISTLTRENSNIEIEIEPNTPEPRSFEPKAPEPRSFEPLISILKRDNSNKKIGIEPKTPESRSYKHRPSILKRDNSNKKIGIEPKTSESRSYKHRPSILKRDNSNKKIGIGPKTPEPRSFEPLISILKRDNSKTPKPRSHQPQPLKSVMLKDLSIPIIRVDALEECCNRLSEENNNLKEKLKESLSELSEENNNLKEKLKELQKQPASLPSLTNNTGTNMHSRYIIDLRNIKEVCRTCLSKSKNLTHINDKITLPNAQATEIVISKALESIMSAPLAVSDNVPNQICETCKNQIIFIATSRFAFEKANAILQLHSAGRLEKKPINKQNTIERDNTEINNLPQCKVEEIDIFEEPLIDLQSPEQIDYELVDSVNDDLVSDGDSHESDKSVAYVSKVDPVLLRPDISIEEVKPKEEPLPLQTDISIGGGHNRPKSPKYSKTVKLISQQIPKSVSHTCPICFNSLPLDDFIPHIGSHKALQKYLHAPKNIRKARYIASPHTGKGLLGGEGEILHSCHVCQKQLKAVECITHLSQHLAADQYTCEKCGRIFKKKQFLLSHLVVHNEDLPYKCDTCGKGFLGEMNYNCHLLTHKDDELPHACPCCDKKFSNPLHVKRHMTIHTENINYSEKYKYKRCKYCYQNIATKSFKSHICKNHGSYMCRYCQELFETVAARVTHIRSVHNTTPKAGFCTRCNVAVMDLRTHRTSKHPRPKTQHLCTVCGSHTWNISVHMYQHRTRRVAEKERTYQCPICSKLFHHPSLLKRHVLVHSGEKPYMCSFCARSFSDKYNLKVHERIHVGERSHVCTFCNKRFLEKSYLRRHMKTHKEGSCQKKFYDPVPDILKDELE
ncbi:uncharacterized protein LOC114329750 isoform X2 [Diabrotica virgifera virgifera]|uniref:Uncharacterized protein LOC114329750 isoform X2 n=1 Tax=Diabrotica virgifera virgifera TaxID=50390 RepID=A0A6P7FP38_DIAVI|nr:uncharacterized protein LOC114329750 isoform X2 [Diabrotica virgifera virgifera]